MDGTEPASGVSVRCAPPNGADFDGLVSTIDSGHLGALYVRIPEHSATCSSDIRPPIPGDPATFDTLL